jgi:hypothetical protein
MQISIGYLQVWANEAIGKLYVAYSLKFFIAKLLLIPMIEMLSAGDGNTVS